MNAIAQRGDQVLYDLGGGKGAIMDTETELLSRPMAIESLMARGYWEPISGDVRKYDEAQPRDENGRWVAGASSEEDLSAEGNLGIYANRWIAQDSANIRAALAGNYVTPDGYGGVRGREMLLEEGRTLVRAANRAAPTTEPLWRGMALRTADYNQLKSDLTPGKKIDLNLASWTKNEQFAEQFAANTWGTAGGGERYAVEMRLEPGAHALEIATPDRQGFSELLSAGRYEVASADYGDHNPISWQVTLRQVATLDPAHLVGTKMEALTEPPHFLPWLEAYFNHRMVPPKESK